MHQISEEKFCTSLFLSIFYIYNSNSFSRQIGTECRRWRRDSWCSTPARLSPIFLKCEKGKMGWRGGVTIASSGLSDFPCARPASLSDTNLWWWRGSNWWLEGENKDDHLMTTGPAAWLTTPEEPWPVSPVSIPSLSFPLSSPENINEIASAIVNIATWSRFVLPLPCPLCPSYHRPCLGYLLGKCHGHWVVNVM